MGCREWGIELTDWVLDELSPEKVRRVEEHIKQCAECARSAQRLLAVRQALTSSLIDREMPAHLVLVGEKPQSRFAGFWAALLRTAALSATAAAIFLGVVSAGFRYVPSRLLPSTAREEPALTRTELQALVSRAVAAQVALQSKDIQAATSGQVESLRQEQTSNWARFAQRLDYLELAQNSEWKETQRQKEIISLVAHYR